MSIVVAVKKHGHTVMAADSLISFGDMRMPADNLQVEKIRRVGGSLFASTGWGLYDNVLDDYLARQPAGELSDERAIFSFFMALWKELHARYTLVKDQPDEDGKSPFGDLDASFLIANQTGIFHVGSDMSVSRMHQYCAIGSGGDYGLGALHALYGQNLDAETIARCAVETACAFDTKCGGEILVRHVDEARASEPKTAVACLTLTE